ncbi:PP2C family protein-serine/threonine phosphatase [Pseudolysinimonas sp.]|uniref:PP2C family protein-serine/threonine phosphatase n=1 Tax=Pseudolysinimonas sp. TaxID=2680009 RepID=UPI003F7ED7A8
MSAPSSAPRDEPPRASARSELGHVRAVNEDSVLARFPLYLVADGMGGHDRGDVASRRTIEVIDAAIAADGPTTAAELVAAVHAANAAVHALGAEALSGTTLTGLAVTTGPGGEIHWTLVNVGDSRVYRWNGRALTQLTVDHSVVQELIDAGALDPVDADQHPERNTITRAVGPFDTVEVDVWLLPYAPGQTFVVCSDGLTKELPLERIEHLLASHSSRDGSLADALVDAALAAGGRDNVTAIVVETPGSAEDPIVGTGTRERPRELEDTLPRGIS